MAETLEQILARKVNSAVGGKTLEQILAEGNQYQPPPDINEPPPSKTPPDVEAMRTAGGKKDQQRLLLEGALMGGGALIGGVGGGMIGRLLPAARNAGRIAQFGDYAARLAPELLGEYAGTYAGGRASGMTPEQARRAASQGAVIGLGARGVVETGTRLAAKAAGVSPEAVSAGINDPRILAQPDRNAELDMAHRMKAQLEAEGAEVTPYHRVYQEQFLGPVEHRRIDVREYADILRSQIAGNPNPASRSADRVLQRMADDLEGIGNESDIPFETPADARLNLPQSPDIPFETPPGTIPYLPESPSISVTIPRSSRGGIVSGGATPIGLGGPAEVNLPPEPTIRANIQTARTPRELHPGEPLDVILPQVGATRGIARTGHTPPELHPGEAPNIELPQMGATRGVARTSRTPEAMGGTGPEMTLGELDAWIRNSLTDPLHGAYTKASEAILNKRLMAARAAMSERLYERLGTGASSVQKLASRRIGAREAVENTFNMGTDAKPSGAGAEKIRNIRAATGDAQKNREVLAAHDAEYDTHLLDDAERLSMQREWNSDDLAVAYAVDSALQPTRPGFVKGVALPVARVGARITTAAGPTAAAISAYRKRKRIKVGPLSPQGNP